MSETCGNLTTGCPCDAQYEDRCTNSWGDSWCTPKIWPCPLDCAADEMLCYSTVYDASGHPDWMTPGNQRLSPCEMAAYSAQELCVDERLLPMPSGARGEVHGLVGLLVPTQGGRRMSHHLCCGPDPCMEAF